MNLSDVVYQIRHVETLFTNKWQVNSKKGFNEHVSPTTYQLGLVTYTGGMS